MKGPHGFAHTRCSVGLYPGRTTFLPLVLSYLSGGGLVTQWCLTLCNPMDCSPPGSSVHGIFPARVLTFLLSPISFAVRGGPGGLYPADICEVFCVSLAQEPPGSRCVPLASVEGVPAGGGDSEPCAERQVSVPGPRLPNPAPHQRQGAALGVNPPSQPALQD